MCFKQGTEPTWVTRRSRGQGGGQGGRGGIKQDYLSLATPGSPVWILPSAASISAAKSCWTVGAG